MANSPNLALERENHDHLFWQSLQASCTLKTEDIEFSVAIRKRDLGKSVTVCNDLICKNRLSKHTVNGRHHLFMMRTGSVAFGIST